MTLFDTAYLPGLIGIFAFTLIAVGAQYAIFGSLFGDWLRSKLTQYVNNRKDAAELPRISWELKHRHELTVENAAKPQWVNGRSLTQDELKEREQKFKKLIRKRLHIELLGYFLSCSFCQLNAITVVMNLLMRGISVGAVVSGVGYAMLGLFIIAVIGKLNEPQETHEKQHETGMQSARRLPNPTPGLTERKPCKTCGQKKTQNN